jgi:prolipoprotein diacylglyceryl transferase
MTVLAAIPSPTQGVWHLGPLPLRGYALSIIAGIVLACWIAEKRWVARGGAQGEVLDIAVWAVPFGIVGGRLYHVLTTPEPYFGRDGDPVRALFVWEGGLGIWGAIALGALGAWIGCRRRGIPLPAFGDAIAPGIAVAQAVGRLGNWFNNELYGRATDLPWALTVHEWDQTAGRAVLGPDGQPVVLGTFHPTFLYELLWDLGVAALVVWADRRYRLGHGRAFALYVAAYCAGRFWIELLRIDTAERFLGLRLNVFTSVIVFVLAVAYLLWQRGRPREVLTRADSSTGSGTGGGGTGDGVARHRAPEDGAPEDGAPADRAPEDGAPADGAAVAQLRSRTARGAGDDTRGEGREPSS